MAAKKKKYRRPWPPAPSPFPWLVYSHGENYEYQTFGTVTNPNKTRLSRIPGLQGTIHYCTFSCSPSDPNCMILLSENDVPLIIFLQLGDKQWIELNCEKEVERCLKESGELVQQGDERYNPLSIISCNGNLLYAETFLTPQRLFLIEKLKLDGTVMSSLGKIPRAPRCITQAQRFLVELQGKIYSTMFGLGLIVSDNEIVVVDVHRLDPSKMIWEKVEHDPDLVFFVADVYGNYAFCWQSIELEIHEHRTHFPSNKNLCCYRSSTESDDEQAKTRCIMAQEEYARVQVREGESNVVVEKGGNEERKHNDLPLDIADEIAGRLTLVD
ncbi:Uncharacterized protein TCM_030860 [Theobroma cacao]|uniref:KIB1-4 beta-propeller domain-containing protein n=1 Tax=Theobroma cacao TaxID=3641 RepID=A0A061FCV1_THECC|nr:Uncharacterized protein TCM_030860 [Theobroma cacao]